MKILVLYFKIGRKKVRNYLNEHLYSFRHYVDQVEFYYFNAFNGIPRFLTIPKFDGIIIHHTFLIRRWNKKYYSEWSKKLKNLRLVKGYKVGIPQDEYVEIETLVNFFKEFDIKTIYTCLSEKDYHKVYPPDRIKFDKIETVLPGYIDEITAEKIRSLDNNNPRPIDLGYRAKKMPFWLGYHAQLKYELAEIFNSKLKNCPITTDIAIGGKDTFYGDKWYKFLLRCNVVLGCEGGASLFDPSGTVRQAVEDYLKKKPGTSFADVEKECFPGKDYGFDYFTISPRHFESIVTKTCQVLLEGNYSGILLPDIHYIELKKDYRNLDSVIQKIKDVAYCRRMAEQAYEDIYGSGRYTYKLYAHRIINDLSRKVTSAHLTFGDRIVFWLVRVYLRWREFVEPILIKIYFPIIYIKIYKLNIFREFWNRKIRKMT